MNESRSIIMLLFLGLSILPSIVGGSETPVPSGKSILMEDLWPKKLLERNASKMGSGPFNKTDAVKKVAEKIMRLTVPFFGRMHHFPKYFSDLKREAGAESEETTTEPQGANASPIAGYVKLFRMLVQHVWKDASELIDRKRMVGRDEV